MLAQLDFHKPMSLSQPLETNYPLVVNEDLVHAFKYWNEGMQKGIRYDHELYTHFQSHSTFERLKAYDAAYRQAEQGFSVCITVSKTHYSIWLGLRSLNRLAQKDLPIRFEQPDLV